MLPLGGFLGRLLGLLMQLGLPFMKNILTPLAKTILMPLGITAAASAIDAVIQKKVFGSLMTTFIISNEEMNDVMKIVKSVGESGLLLKGLSETMESETKEQNGGCLSILLCTLDSSILGSVLLGKGAMWADERQGAIRAGQALTLQFKVT